MVAEVATNQRQQATVLDRFTTTTVAVKIAAISTTTDPERPIATDPPYFHLYAPAQGTHTKPRSLSVLSVPVSTCDTTQEERSLSVAAVKETR